MKKDYTTNSHYLTYTFFFWKFGRMYFLNWEVEGLKQRGQLIFMNEEEQRKRMGLCFE